MTLKKKTASILLLIMVISSLVFFAVFKLIVFKGFVEAENSNSVHDMNQCISVLNIDIKHLDNFVHDWSSWDSTYNFVVEGNQEFIKENLVVDVYLDQGLSLIHCYDRDGSLVWGKTYDLETEEEIPLDLSDELNPALFQKLITQNDPEGYTSGIVQTSIGTMMIAAHPILTSENKGPSHGSMVMGRLFNRDSIALLSENLGVELDAWSVSDEQMPEAVRALIPSLNYPESVRFVYASSDILHAYSIIRDIGDQPAMILKASFPRTITQKGMKAYRIGMIIFLGAGLLVFIIISGMFGVYVLNPIAALTESALAIGVSTKDLKGFGTSRKDEIGVLSREFAAMVERLTRSEEGYRILAENARDVIWVFDFTLGYTYVSPSIKDLCGYTAEEILRQSFHQLLSPESQKLAAEVLDREISLEQSGQAHGPEWSYKGEFEMVHKDGSSVCAEINLSLLYDENNKPKGLMGITRDITERKQVEVKLKQRTDAMESAIDGIAILDEKEEYIYLNKAHANIYGYKDAGELIGKPWRILYDFDELQRFEQKIMPDLHQKGHWQGEAIGKKADGSKFPQYVSLTALDSGGLICVVRDNTQRKRAEEALKKSEANYRQLFENSPAAIYRVDFKNGKIVQANDVFCKYYGCTQEEITSVSPYDILTEDSKKLFQERVEKIALGIEVPETVEYEVVNKNGRRWWVNLHNKNIYDAQGLVVASDVVAHDITEHKRAEDAIKKSEERYRTIFESTATANIIVAEDTTILMANNNVTGLTGYSKQELEGKMSWTAFIHRDDLEKMKGYHAMRRIDPGSAPSSYEFRAINRKGEILDLLMSAAVIPGTKESVVSMIDVTELKRSEHARIESETRFQQLAQLLPETVYEADVNGVLTFVNQTWFEKFGYVQDELSRGMTVFDISMPADHDRIRAINQRLIQGEPVGLGEYSARKKDGSTFPALVHATAIHRDGNHVGSRGFIVDISEKKTLENQLARAQKMEAIGTLAGGVAHDFNNLLMGILGNISLILLQIDQRHPVHDRLKSVEEYVQRGSDLTKQLLGFARGGKYEVKPTDLGRFIKESSELFGRTKKEIHIHHRTQKGLWTVEVDRGQMEQVLLNMYVNAWHAMPHGGDLYLSEENVELDSVMVSPYEIDPGKFVKVTVTDTGVGMDELTKTRIFEPFFTTKEQGRGTGLGLASAYGIIKNHGGFVHVESEVDVGTTFMIYLPASNKDVRHDLEPEEELHRGQEIILLIDDEEMILDVSGKMLEGLGYRVITASGGKMGAQTYEQNKDRIDLVILDMVMPDFGGKESFNTLIRINPSVKVLLSSGYSLDSQAKEIMDRGCRGFIQKPFTMTDLSRKIREILDKQ